MIEQHWCLENVFRRGQKSCFSRHALIERVRFSCFLGGAFFILAKLAEHLGGLDLNFEGTLLSLRR